MKEPKYREEYEAFEDELAVAKAVIAARKRAGLSRDLRSWPISMETTS